MIPITASMLYDYVSCPHRVAMDPRGNPADRDEVSPFVQLLWERGFVHEQEVVSELRVPFLDLSKIEDVTRAAEPIRASGHVRPHQKDPMQGGGCRFLLVAAPNDLEDAICLKRLLF
jgi:hypothetical protein